MPFDGTDESLEDWTYAGGGRFVREGCTIKSVGGFGLLYTKRDYEAPHSHQARVDDAGRRQLRRLHRFPDREQTSIDQGDEIQIDPTDNPAQTTGAIYLEQAAHARRRAEPARRVERVRDHRARRPQHRVPERRQEDRR